MWGTLDRFVDRFAYWVGAILLLTAGFSWLSKQLVWMQPYGWPEAIFVGVAAVLVVILILSIALVALRYFKPLPALEEGQKDEITAPINSTATSDALEVIDRMRRAVDDRTQYVDREIQLTDQKIDELTRRIGELDKQINEPMSIFTEGGPRLEKIGGRLDQIESFIKTVTDKRLERSVFILLSYATHMMNIDLIEYQIANAPFALDTISEDGILSDEQRAAINDYMQICDRQLANTRWDRDMKSNVARAEQEAERIVRETPNHKRPTAIDQLDFRLNVICQKKYRQMLATLRYSKRELKDELRTYRGMLIEQLQRSEAQN